jgi:hypothetical protein
MISNISEQGKVVNEKKLSCFVFKTNEESIFEQKA